MEHVLRVVTEMAATQHLSNTTQSSLEELSKQLQIKPYKERAMLAIDSAGLRPPEISQHQNVPALCNPRQAAEQRGVLFPLSDMIMSRVVDTWRCMTGIRGVEDWSPGWDFPPPNPTKPNKSIPKPSVNAQDYAFPVNGFLCSKALKTEAEWQEKPHVTVNFHRLQDWEQAVTTCLGIVNMMDIFSSSLNRDMQNVWDCLETYAGKTLPPDMVDLLDEKHRIKADQESRARAVQDLTNLLTWLLAENILLRRDHVLGGMSLSKMSKDVLRMQPFGGPFLFNGRTDELLRKDSERQTASMVMKMNEKWFVKKSSMPSATVTKQSESTAEHSQQSTSGRSGTSNYRRSSFRSDRTRGQGRGQWKYGQENKAKESKSSFAKK